MDYWISWWNRPYRCEVSCVDESHEAASEWLDANIEKVSAVDADASTPATSCGSGSSKDSLPITSIAEPGSPSSQKSFASQLELEEVPEQSSPQQKIRDLLDLSLKAQEQLKNEIMSWQDQSFREQGTLNLAPCNFGKVVRVRDKHGFCFAVKKMPIAWTKLSHSEFMANRKPGVSEQPWRDLAVLKILNQVQFPFAMPLLGIFRDEEWLYVASPLATHGDLYQWSCSCDAEVGPVREAAIKPIASQVCEAVRALHDLGVSHRDISLENILVTDTDSHKAQVKLIDFGMSTAFQFCRQHCGGKQCYRAPEVYTAESPFDVFLMDAFAVGIVLYSAATQDYPWQSTKPKTCPRFEYVQMHGFIRLLEVRRTKCTEQNQADNFKGRPLVEVFSAQFTTLLAGLLQLNPRQRFCLGELCYRGDVWRTSAWGCWLECLADVGKSQFSNGEDLFTI